MSVSLGQSITENTLNELGTLINGSFDKFYNPDNESGINFSTTETGNEYERALGFLNTLVVRDAVNESGASFSFARISADSWIPYHKFQTSIPYTFTPDTGYNFNIYTHGYPEIIINPTDIPIDGATIKVSRGVISSSGNIDSINYNWAFLNSEKEAIDYETLASSNILNHTVSGGFNFILDKPYPIIESTDPNLGLFDVSGSLTGTIRPDIISTGSTREKSFSGAHTNFALVSFTGTYVNTSGTPSGLTLGMGKTGTVSHIPVHTFEISVQKNDSKLKKIYALNKSGFAYSCRFPYITDEITPAHFPFTLYTGDNVNFNFDQNSFAVNMVTKLSGNNLAHDVAGIPFIPRWREIPTEDTRLPLFETNVKIRNTLDFTNYEKNRSGDKNTKLLNDGAMMILDNRALVLPYPHGVMSGNFFSGTYTVGDYEPAAQRVLPVWANDNVMTTSGIHTIKIPIDHTGMTYFNMSNNYVLDNTPKFGVNNPASMIFESTECGASDIGPVQFASYALNKIANPFWYARISNASFIWPLSLSRWDVDAATVNCSQTYHPESPVWMMDQDVLDFSIHLFSGLNIQKEKMNLKHLRRVSPTTLQNVLSSSRSTIDNYAVSLADVNALAPVLATNKDTVIQREQAFKSMAFNWPSIERIDLMLGSKYNTTTVTDLRSNFTEHLVPFHTDFNDDKFFYADPVLGRTANVSGGILGNNLLNADVNSTDPNASTTDGLDSRGNLKKPFLYTDIASGDQIPHVTIERSNLFLNVFYNHSGGDLQLTNGIRKTPFQSGVHSVTVMQFWQDPHTSGTYSGIGRSRFDVNATNGIVSPSPTGGLGSATLNIPSGTLAVLYQYRAKNDETTKPLRSISFQAVEKTGELARELYKQNPFTTIHLPEKKDFVEVYVPDQPIICFKEVGEFDGSENYLNVDFSGLDNPTFNDYNMKVRYRKYRPIDSGDARFVYGYNRVPYAHNYNAIEEALLNA